jgi:hypothetical protein
MLRNPRMDESDPDSYTIFLLEYFGNSEGGVGATCKYGIEFNSSTHFYVI